MSAAQPTESQNITQFNRFLKNNNQLLQQKYHEHFIHDRIKISSKQPKLQTVVSFIADVFSFDNIDVDSKDKDKKATNNQTIKNSLKNSYETFLLANQDIKQFNVQTAIALLRFCIESNQMFAVHYQNNKDTNDVKTKFINNNKDQPSLPHTNPEENQQQPNQSSKHALQTEKQNINNNNNMKKGQNLQTSGMGNQFSPNGHNGSEQGSVIAKPRQRNTFDDGELQNQFNFHEQIKLDLDPLLVKKNIRIVFQYYCKQQMALSPNLSFDRIQRQSHMMTLSKILLMARMMNILNGSITREVLINKFRKISQGKRQIDFKKFDILMSQLQISDPSLIARAELNCPNIHAYLKTTKKPFDTQDMLPRQLIKNRNFTNKLTLHSGKMQTDLIQDLKMKRNSCMLEEKDSDRSKQRQHRSTERSSVQNNSKISSNMNAKMKEYYEEVAHKAMDRYEKQKEKEKEAHYLNRKQTEIITTKQLVKAERNYSHDLSMLKMRKIIGADKQDDKWLGEYKISSSIKKAQAYDESLQKKRSFEDKQRNLVLIQDLRKRVKQIQQTQHSSNGLDQTKPYISSGKRV